MLKRLSIGNPVRNLNSRNSLPCSQRTIAHRKSAAAIETHQTNQPSTLKKQQPAAALQSISRFNQFL